MREAIFYLKTSHRKNEENKYLHLYLENFKNEVLSKQCEKGHKNFSQCMIFQKQFVAHMTENISPFGIKHILISRHCIPQTLCLDLLK